MQLLNKDIKGIMLFNININDIKKLLKTTKNLDTLKLLLNIYVNEVSYTLHYQIDHGILKSNILKERYDIPVPKTIKRVFLNGLAG
jgi:hypothetical protein